MSVILTLPLLSCHVVQSITQHTCKEHADCKPKAEHEYRITLKGKRVGVGDSFLFSSYVPSTLFGALYSILLDVLYGIVNLTLMISMKRNT